MSKRRRNAQTIKRPVTPVKININERLFTVPETAAALRKAQKTIWMWLGSPEPRIACFKIGGNVRIPESEILRILTEGYVPARRSA